MVAAAASTTTTFVTPTSTHPPLTTIFTAPTSCTNSVAFLGSEPYGTGSHLILQETWPQRDNCFASGWTSPVDTYAGGGNVWTGSPMCPSGQSVAQTFTTGMLTTAICCSNSWGDVYENSNWDGPTAYTFYICRTSWTEPTTTTLYGSIESGGPIVMATKPLIVTAPWDLESTAEYLFVYNDLTMSHTAAPTGTIQRTTSPVTSTASSAASSPTSGASHAGEDHLSGGAIAGICVGVILVLLLAAAGIAFMLWKRRKSALAEQRGTKNPLWTGKAELEERSSKVIMEADSKEAENNEPSAARTSDYSYYREPPREVYSGLSELGGS